MTNTSIGTMKFAADICSFHCNLLNKFLPFCVRTGAPELRDPAIDNALATVDIFFNCENQKSRKQMK